MQTKAENQKKAVGEKAVQYIKNGMTIGLGSGTTVYWMLKKLGEIIGEDFQVRGVPSSVKTERWAKEFNIPLIDLSEVDKLDVAIDGANEVDVNFSLIKGGGGSLLREKLVNDAADTLIIVIDDKKMTDVLGAFPLPVEVVPFAWKHTARRVENLGCSPMLRMVNEKPFVTDNGNYILDCKFQKMEHPEKLHHKLKLTLGVVETGLFVNMTNKVIVARNDTVEVIDIKNND